MAEDGSTVTLEMQVPWFFRRAAGMGIFGLPHLPFTPRFNATDVIVLSRMTLDPTSFIWTKPEKP